MRRHYYERLEVTGTELVAAFDPRAKDGLVRAVEHLGKVATGREQPTLSADHPAAEASAPLLKTGGENGHRSSDRRGVWVWLRAVTHVKIANYRWPVNALLSWEQVEGKTEEEIWRLFDSYTDKNIDAMMRSRTQYPL